MIRFIKKINTLLRSSYYSFRIRNTLHTDGLRIGKNSIFIQPQRMKIGSNVTIGERSILNCYKSSKSISLAIGKNTQIGRDFQLNAYKSVEIGEEVLISDRVYISDATHSNENKNLSIMSQQTFFKGKVVIGNGSWIGINACILPGVTIGKNSIIGANSVVVNDVEDNTVVSGIPATFLYKKY